MQAIMEAKSRDSSASPDPRSPNFGQGTGAYDIEDIDDFEYGRGSEAGTGNGEIEDDEKLLEDLEDKQLRERIGLLHFSKFELFKKNNHISAALESDNSNIKEQVWKLEHGRNWMENRLTAMETQMQALKEGTKPDNS